MKGFCIVASTYSRGKEDRSGCTSCRSIILFSILGKVYCRAAIDTVVARTEIKLYDEQVVFERREGI